jgi:aspartyl/asparaginyl beta-hydroxylase (cupin superfamily)
MRAGLPDRSGDPAPQNYSGDSALPLKPFSMDQAEAQKHTTTAWAALQRGDAATALEELEEMIASNDRATPWMMVARARSILGDANGEADALGQQLALEPRNILALLRTGDLKRAAGDDRAAGSFYQVAVGAAAQETQLPPALIPLIDQARQHILSAQAKFTDHLETALGRSAIGETARVGHAVDLLLGRKQLYLQQPNSFYFPGLPQRQFYERDEFDWLHAVEAAVPEMQAELQAALAFSDSFDPYVVATGERPSPTNRLLNDANWGARYFWQNGEVVNAQAEACPATMAALAKAPMPVIAERSPMALWSMLKPGTHIDPHHGLLNTRLICHVPLIVPGNCALRVGNEVREWEAGETLIFDDSIEHEAWNRSTSTRVVLLFEIWRPEITRGEREALTAIFETINSYHGAPVDVG